MENKSRKIPAHPTACVGGKKTAAKRKAGGEAIAVTRRYNLRPRKQNCQRYSTTTTAAASRKQARQQNPGQTENKVKKAKH